MEVKFGYRQTDVGLIPEDWAVGPLGNHVHITSGESPSAFNFTNVGLPYFKVEQLSNSDKYLDGFSTPYHFDKGKTVPHGSVVFAKRGAAIALNKVRIFAQASFMDTNLMALTPSEGLNGEFLFYGLGYIGLWRLAHTTSVPQINNKHIKPLAFPLPKAPEQHAIAEALSDMDRLLAGLERLIAKKRDLKQAAMQQLLTGKTRLPGFHGEWVPHKLGGIGKFKNGLNKESGAFGHGSPFVNLMDVFGVNAISSTNHLCLVASTKFDQDAYDLRQGDVLFIRSSVKPSGVGLTAVVECDLTETVYSGFIIRFRDNGLLDLDFKKHCFYEEGFRNKLIASSSVSANTNINQNALRQLSILLPPTKAEQAAIAEVLTGMDAELAALEKRREKTRDLKQAMVQELLTGRTRLI